MCDSQPVSQRLPEARQVQLGLFSLVVPSSLVQQNGAPVPSYYQKLPSVIRYVSWIYHFPRSGKTGEHVTCVDETCRISHQSTAPSLLLQTRIECVSGFRCRDVISMKLRSHKYQVYLLHPIVFFPLYTRSTNDFRHDFLHEEA